jgi:ATP-dependent RNA helicase DeaD
LDGRRDVAPCGGDGKGLRERKYGLTTQEETQKNVQEPQSRFADLPFSRQIKDAVAEMGWETPTPIQSLTLPALLRGEDVVGLAQTGSGKTAAFGIPLLETLDSRPKGVQALILVPTRELANQAASEIQKLSGGGAQKPVVLCGGMPIGPQIKALRKKTTSVVVGTPGRTLDHLNRGTLRLDGVGYLVLDEADRMLDMGFAPDVGRILSYTPSERQTALFSATMPNEIRKVVDLHMRSPKWIRVEAETTTVDGVEQVYYKVDGKEKTRALRSLLDAEEDPLALVFRRTKHGATKLHRQLEKEGYSSGLLHGGKTQSQRDKAIAAFSKGRTRVLIATNVAARGLDIQDISHVINYDLPEDADTYIHRIGRTARAGKEGVAATIVANDEKREFEKLARNLPTKVRESKLPAQS